MSSVILHDALARLDKMDATLATLRLLAQAYDEDGEDGGHVASYLSCAVSDAAADLARLARTREVANA